MSTKRSVLQHPYEGRGRYTNVSAGPRRILVVDDDPLVATTIQRELQPEGYEVEVALGGAGAFDQARDRRPDLVVLDGMMPGIDGLEVCRQLRADGDLPILFLTARTTTADRVRGLDSGADDYLVKPFAYAELLARVRALLRRGGAPPARPRCFPPSSPASTGAGGRHRRGHGGRGDHGRGRGRAGASPAGRQPGS